MEEKKGDGRCFLIKHNACGSLITLDSRTFVNSFKSKERSYFLRCPNCNKFLIKNEAFDAFMEFLETYNKIDTEILEDASIREIPDESEID